MDFLLDNWQQKVIDHNGSLHLRCGRQTGKSTIIALKIAKFMKEYPDTTLVVSSSSKRQGQWLFDKARLELEDMVLRNEVEFQGQPTMNRVALTNGSEALLLPLGKTGMFVRGKPISVLVVDEAPYVPDAVWDTIIPSMATYHGKGLAWIWMLGTPFGKGGYFFDCEGDPDFLHVHVRSDQCPRISHEFLAKEKARMSKNQYLQEYDAEYVEDVSQFFSMPLIKKCASFIEWSYEKEYNQRMKYFLGVDIARYGGDENAFVIAELDEKNKVKIVRVITTERVSLTDTIERIRLLNKQFDFNRIFVDDHGVGGGVFDVLHDEMGRKIVGLNNARKSTTGDRKRQLLKEDMYANALVLMESGKLQMIANMQLMRSLKSITFEYRDNGLFISGNYSHVAEGFIRACWCVKEKGLKAYIM